MGLMVMRHFEWRKTTDGVGDDLAQAHAFAGTGVERVRLARWESGSIAAAKTIDTAGIARFLHPSRVGPLRLLALALALLPARVSLSNTVQTHDDTSLPAVRLHVVEDELLASDCLARIGHCDSGSTRQTEKRPAALRKHSRHPSPTDDDGTRSDPTDEDETSDNLIGDGDGEAAIAIWSPAMVCFVDTCEDLLSLLSLPSTNPLFLVLQRFRC
jgi:hypothetical protein